MFGAISSKYRSNPSVVLESSGGLGPAGGLPFIGETVPNSAFGYMPPLLSMIA